MNELDILYSPSRWSKRLHPDEVIKSHVEFVIKASEWAKTNIPCELNIPYGSKPNEKLDIFGTDLPQDSPIFIYVHGGYWQELSREISSYPVAPLYKNKFKVIVLGYDLCPAVTLSEIVEEIQRGFDYCLSYAKAGRSRGIYIAGHSAGAHLVATLFGNYFKNLKPEDQTLLKEVYFISGVFDLVPLVDTYVNEALRLDKSTAAAVSPQHLPFACPTADVRFHIVVGEHDSPPFKSQSEEFNKKLRAIDTNVEMITVHGRDHFDIVEALNNEEYEIIKMIVK